MKKSERLKSRIKIKFKYFILARILTLFFAVVFFLSAGGPVASAADNFFNFNQESAYSEPFSKLIEFLNEKKNELEKYDGDFLGAKSFLSPADLSAEEEEEEGGNNNSSLSADEINPAVSSFASAAFESIKSFVVDNPKQYFGTVFESVKNFIFPGDSQNSFEYKSPNSESSAQEMENLKQQYAEAIDETKAISQKFNLLQKEMEKIKNSGVVVRQPIIEQKAVEKTIEKIVSGLSQTDLDSGLSNLRTELNNFNTNLLNQINTLSASSNRQTSAVYQAVSLTNKIDSLSGTRLTNITVNGVSGLTDADIPDSITASNYLLLVGGTITGSTTISGQTNLSNATTSLLTVSNGAWFTSGNVGIGTTSPYAKLSVVGPVAAEYFHATSTTATSTFSGQTVAGFAPTLAHSFGSWSSGVSGANPLGASLIINPSSAAADSNLLSLSVNGSAKFLVDAEGDVFANAVTVVGGTTLSTTTASTFTVENNTYLGDATTTDITYFNSRIADSLIPTADNLLDLGDSANWLRWRTGYFGTSVGIGGTATSTGTQLTTSGSYLIDSNNTLSINTTNNKAVSFGTGNIVLPYASTTALTVSGSAYIGSLNGPLQANNGLVSATTSVGSIYGGTGINSSALTGLAQIVAGTWSASSTLSTAFGGTGWGNLQANTILLGNGAGRLATTSAGTDGYVLALSAGVPTWLATSTLSTITGTLSVAKGGTGQTSFGQGWLNSNGTDLSASTSPTVNYVVATSTTATSTFPYLSVTTNSNLGTVVGGTWQGTAIGDAYLTKSGDWTGTLDTYNGSDLLARANHTGTQGVATLSNYDWTFLNNYGAVNLTGSSTKPIWAQGGLNASSTSNFVYASTTALTISGNSYLGTVSSGAWNGTVVGAQYGGTGINSSALTGIAQIVSGTWSASSTLSTAYGGTGWNSIAAGYIPFGNGAAALATSTSFYWDNGNSRLGIGTSTPDSKLTVFNSADDSAIEFSSASGSTYKWTVGMDYSDAGKFKIASSTALGSIDRFTIDGNGYVGIGTSTPARRLDVADSGNNNPQMRLSRETDVYTDFSVAQTTGDLSLALYGTNADDISLFMPDGSTGANLWVCEGAACPNGISFTGGGNLFVEGVIKYATSTTPKTRRSIILTAAGAIVPATSGAAKTQVDGTNHSYYVLDYDASSDEAAYWQWTMPDSYDNGTIDVTYYWEAGATSGDTILCFQAKGLSANSSEDIDSALSSAVCETDTAQANANDLASITETNATSNFTAGEYITFKVFRDADAGGDTMSGDARLVKVKIEYGVATESD